MAEKPPKTFQTIPAQPGFTIWWIDEDGPGAFKGEPIVGWIVEQIERPDLSTFYWQHPITAAECVADYQSYVIECPDGRFVAPQDQTFDDRQAFLDHLSRRKAG